MWVACNVDPTLPSERGPLPGNGSLVAVLRTANRLEPQVAGKPAPTLMRKAVERAGGTTPLVVGDVLYTDIQGGRAAGMATLLVLTGAATPADLLAAPPEARPDYIGADLDALDLDPDDLAPGPRPGWTVGAVRTGVTLSGGDPLDALRALCAEHWRTAAARPGWRPRGTGRRLHCAPSASGGDPRGPDSATVGGADTVPEPSEGKP